MVEAGQTRPSAWYILDTADGRLLATVRGEAPNSFQGWIDADAPRLYHRVDPGSDMGVAPRPLRRIACDPTSKAELGRLDLPAVLAKFWRTGRTSKPWPISPRR